MANPAFMAMEDKGKGHNGLIGQVDVTGVGEAGES